MDLRKTFPTFSAAPGAILVAAIFFLGSTDQALTCRFLGYNLRWSQLFLALFAVPALIHLQRNPEAGKNILVFLKKLFRFWSPFFAVYFIAAVFSSTPKLTLIKWAWAIFNITLAAVFCLNSRFLKHRAAGFQYGVLAIAVLIWAQALVLHWFHWPMEHTNGLLDFPIHFTLLPPFLPLGFAQSSFFFEGFLMFRPNAFFYEPSYAGAALSFALPLTLFLEKKGSLKIPLFSPWVASAIILAGSRLGILNLVLVYLIGLGGFLAKRRWDWVLQLLKSASLGFLLLVVFSLNPGGNRYIRFLENPLGPKQMIQRIQDYKNTAPLTGSEGGRIRAMIKVPGRWFQHPVLGNGVAGVNPETEGLMGSIGNTWAELLLESGLLGFLAFLGAVLATLKAAAAQRRQYPVFLLTAAAWLVHFAVNLNLTPTFPRLDYWLIFFFSVSLLIESPAEK